MNYLTKYTPQVVGLIALLLLFIDSAIALKWNNYTHELLVLASLFFGGAGVIIIKRGKIWMGLYNFSGIVAVMYGCAFLVMGVVCVFMLINYTNS